jgi:hypothetical protein
VVATIVPVVKVEEAVTTTLAIKVEVAEKKPRVVTKVENEC